MWGEKPLVLVKFTPQLLSVQTSYISGKRGWDLYYVKKVKLKRTHVAYRRSVKVMSVRSGMVQTGKHKPKQMLFQIFSCFENVHTSCHRSYEEKLYCFQPQLACGCKTGILPLYLFQNCILLLNRDMNNLYSLLS